MYIRLVCEITFADHIENSASLQNYFADRIENSASLLQNKKPIMNDFDEVIEHVGPFGRYQIQLFLLVNLFDFPAVWAMFMPVFSGAVPDWWCEIDQLETSSNSSALSNNTNSTVVGIGLQNSRLFKECSINGKQCDRIIYDTSFTSIVTQFNLVCDLDYVSDLITTLQMVGLAVGATIFGQLADILGRKKILFGTHLLLVLSSLGSGLAQSWPVYAAFRMIVGAAVGGLLVAALVLPIEYVGKKWRTLTVCLGFWAVGLMILPLWAYFIRDWSHLIIVTSCVTLPLLGLWWVIPESCRWLVTRGRFEEAEKVLTTISEKNKKPLPDLQLLRNFATTEEELQNQRRNFSYWHLFVTPKSAVYTLICMYAWFACSTVYYGISYNLKNLSGDRYLNLFLSGFVEIPALIFVILVNNRLGRRWTIFILFLLAGLSLTSIMIISAINIEKPKFVLVMALIGKSAVSGGWAAVQIFSAETFPTAIRNIGLAACAITARVGGIIAPQIVYLNMYQQQIPFVVFGVIALLCAFLSLFLTETASQPLPDKLTSKATENHTEELEMNGLNIENSEVSKPLIPESTDCNSPATDVNISPSPTADVTEKTNV